MSAHSGGRRRWTADRWWREGGGLTPGPQRTRHCARSCCRRRCSASWAARYPLCWARCCLDTGGCGGKGGTVRWSSQAEALNAQCRGARADQAGAHLFLDLLAARLLAHVAQRVGLLPGGGRRLPLLLGHTRRPLPGWRRRPQGSQLLHGVRDAHFHHLGPVAPDVLLSLQLIGRLAAGVPPRRRLRRTPHCQLIGLRYGMTAMHMRFAAESGVEAPRWRTAL